MKFFRILGRSIRDAFKSVFRNFSLSLASISCITITLLIVTVSILITFNVEHVTKIMESELTIVVFLQNDTEEEDIKELMTTLENKANVESLTYISKDAAKEDMRKENEVFNEIMGTWDEGTNPLSASFKLKVKNVDKISATANEIKKMDHVSIVNYGEDTVEKLLVGFDVAEKFSYGMVIALVLVTVFLIINTIKLTIFSRKREISIMRLVGASNFMIKTPFIIEGMVLGIIGSLVPILATCFGYVALYNQLNGYIGTPMFVLIKPEPFIYAVSIAITIIGMLVGMIGSASAVRKYLKV